ncbi:DeoR/GlpR family DNA-binding transcription regulator [Paenibacillus sp. 1P07SE]|uniref:DeoR/GlpR family DNA-binding transcription regulator n=1 Tax=Paenibacillus sp. 1P07SE TaxID=3132209 RepID=UPI0039A5C428
MRRDAIIGILQESGTLTTAQLIERFGVSEATARRDLETLEQEKKLIRTFGGAVLESVRTEIPFYAKLELHPEEKKEIADKAMTLIQDGEVIGLTGGSTTMAIAKRLQQRHFSNLTVVTNAVNLAYELTGLPGIQLMVTGGIARTQSFELSGPLADHALSQVTISRSFIGADGVSVMRGITTFNELEAQTNRVMIAQSIDSYVVADHSKLNNSSVFCIRPLDAVTAIITDSKAGKELSQPFLQAGIRFI